MSGLREAWFANALAPPAMPRPARAGLVFGSLAVALYLVGLAVLDVTPWRIYASLGRLVDIIGLMLPPSPGSMAHFQVYRRPDQNLRHGCRSLWLPA